MLPGRKPSSILQDPPCGPHLAPSAQALPRQEQPSGRCTSKGAQGRWRTLPATLPASCASRQLAQHLTPWMNCSPSPHRALRSFQRGPTLGERGRLGGAPLPQAGVPWRRQEGLEPGDHGGGEAAPGVTGAGALQQPGGSASLLRSVSQRLGASCQKALRQRLQ